MSPHASFLLNDGTHIPWIGFGTGTALYMQDARHSVTQAIQNGIAHIDGAQVYQNEDSLGLGIKDSGVPREKLFITTKLWKVNRGGGESVRSLLEQSLRNLGVNYVDLFLIHSPKHHPHIEDVWKEMEEVKMAGLTKSIGVSNFAVERLEEVLRICTIPPSVNQIEYHPYVHRAAAPIVEFGKAHNIVTASYGGLTPLIRAPGGPLDPVVETIRTRLEKEIGRPVSGPQVLIKFLNQKGIVAITTTSKATRVKEYLDSLNLPDLTPEEIKAVDEAGSKVHERVYMLDVFNK